MSHRRFNPGSHTAPHSTLRRGAALLIVLATLVLVISASVTIAQVASTARLWETIGECEQIGSGLLQSAETPIQRWLAQESSEVVLRPEVLVPEVAVLDDRWTSSHGQSIHLQITAFDQCGMVPLHAVLSGGSPLRLTLPAGVLAAIDHMSPPRPDAILGLDMIDPSLLGNGLEVFPSPSPELSAPAESPAIGSLLSTHPVQRSSDTAGSNRSLLQPIIVNVNTAPIRLVEAAVRLSGFGGIEQVIEMREQGKSAAAPASNHAMASSSSQSSIHLIASSPCWAFRIDATVGPVRKSWWAIYQEVATTTNPSSSPWKCVQRLVIRH